MSEGAYTIFVCPGCGEQIVFESRWDEVRNEWRFGHQHDNGGEWIDAEPRTLSCASAIEQAWLAGWHFRDKGDTSVDEYTAAAERYVKALSTQPAATSKDPKP